MRTLPVIFCLTCFFFPAIASAQLAPGLKAHAYDLSVAEIDAIKAAVTSILINPESARFGTITASENEKTAQHTAHISASFFRRKSVSHSRRPCPAATIPIVHF
jgi:hypothetical protein